MQIIYFYIVLILSTIPMFLPGIRENLCLLILHIFIATISSLSLFLHKRETFSLYKISHLFFLFFLCIAPILQFKNDVTFWEGRKYPDFYYIYTSFIILCIILIFNLIYSIVYNKSKCSSIVKFSNNISSYIVNDKSLSLKEFLYFIGIDIIILTSVLYLKKFNLFFLFIRGGVTDGENIILEIETDGVPQIAALIIGNFLRPLSVVIYLIAYKLKANKIELLILFIFMLLSAFPTSMPRFSAAAMYIPVMLTFFPLFRKGFIFIFVIGLLVVFPFLNNFRYLTSNSNIEFGIDFEMFLEAHFDAYSNFVHILANDISTFGYQLLGSLLFWVPRSIWPSKPVGSGAFLSEEVNLDWANISCCYFAEGYINFRFLGILIFTIIIAWICASFDKVYWKFNRKVQKQNCFFELIYFLLLGLMFFILRGDLMSSLAFTLGFIFSVLFVYYFLLFIRKYSFRFKF